MTQITKALCWAAILIALALANKFGLIADKDAAVMFAIIPAMWIAMTSRDGARSCRKSAQA